MARTVWRSTDGAEQVVGEYDDAIPVGLASDADDRLDVAVRSHDANVAGIWRRDAAGRWARFAAAETRAGHRRGQGGSAGDAFINAAKLLRNRGVDELFDREVQVALGSIGNFLPVA